LKQLGFNVGLGLREAFKSIGALDPSKMSIITEDQWYAIVHRFVFAEIKRRKEKRGNVAFQRGHEGMISSPVKSPKTVTMASGEFRSNPLTQPMQSRIPS
jgi:hypothetical protein